MKIDILTLIPGVFQNVFNESVLGSALEKQILEIGFHSIRDFGEGRHRVVDDTAFGGGPGMVLKPGPLIQAIRALRENGEVAPVIGLTPQGVKLSQKLLKELSHKPRLMLVCGRYEGFDERIRREFDLEVSIGDYVLSGGEIAAMVFVDSMARLIPGTIGDQASVEQDSFFNGPLDHPQYTRPAVWESLPVPQVLSEGNHESINLWRKARSLKKTAVRRPDLFCRLNLDGKEKNLLQTCFAD
ncbi:MAG: tRNA (guanosine(37)-N1)-methyltransferase TrmD [Candidatus Riflebacteria bacterium]|nr:tRNA (guanosine(37)-N1)-methyltransferase TrmD [Candidatus Riflebacteria bacterium]